MLPTPHAQRLLRLRWLLSGWTAGAVLAACLHANGSPAEAVQQARDLLGQAGADAADLAHAEAALHDILEDVDDPATRGRAALTLASSAMTLHHDLPASIPLFETARKLLAPGSRDWNEATFGLATAVQHRLPVSPTSIQMATQLYEQVLAHDSTSLLAARSLISLGRIDEVLDYSGDQQKLEQARARYQSVIRGWSEDDVAYEAAFRFGSTFIQEAYYPPEELRDEWDWRVEQVLKGVGFLEKWVTGRPDSPLAPGFWEYIGNSYLLLPEQEKWRREALRAYLRATGDGDLIETGQPAPLKASLDRVNPGYLYLRIAGLAHQQGQREVAFEYYSRLISEVPDFAYGPEAALQLTENLGYSKSKVLDRLRWQYQAMGYTDAEIERLVSDFEFLPPPVGVPIPEP